MSTIVTGKVTAEHIESLIQGITYTILPSGKVTVCEITLANGFSVRGESAVVSKENFVKETGEKISLQRAKDQIWQLEGYMLQERIHIAKRMRAGDPEVVEDDAE